MADERPVRIFTRRELLRSAGIVTAAAAAAPQRLFTPAEAAVAADRVQPGPVVPAREAFENLTAAEADLIASRQAVRIASTTAGRKRGISRRSRSRQRIPSKLS